ncbi:TetR/AcrR family transcriptional regulator [Streptomyces sp. MP131-18]|uniref:TetR/AcrR family transcriptional regulator n=1 Tax=Streptomyces sp. MP131-18 TaxID=1857892 RepID=UPI00097C1A55|nr:TetR/AcrR family transcriptional regulator [Streptomyces sp. MP131-18]ONK11808.1 mycofactocin system transcriptional regulator [Streptomyces sp. MP131-18]
MAETAPTAPGTLARTRRAILDAAISVFAEDRAASLGDVAKAAEVGRSTLHRYFPDRAALILALFEDCAESAHRTLRDAALDHGPPAEAFRRLIVALFDLGPRVNFLFNEPQLTSAEWEGPHWERANLPAAELYTRGRAAGFFAAETDMEWFFRTLWYMLGAGWEAVEEGSLPRHEAIAAVTRTLEGGLLSHGPRDDAR